MESMEKWLNESTKTIEDFIKKHQKEIDKVIKSGDYKGQKIDDEERRLWVLNDEGLYNQALDYGVKDI